MRRLYKALAKLQCNRFEYRLTDMQKAMSISSSLFSKSTFDKTFNSVNSTEYLLNGTTIISSDGTLTIPTIVTNSLTTVTTENVTANTIVLNYGITGTPTLNASIQVNRGTSPNSMLQWNESQGKWQIGTTTSLDYITSANNAQILTAKTLSNAIVAGGLLFSGPVVLSDTIPAISGVSCVVIGTAAGFSGQGNYAIAIGNNAGNFNQSAAAIAIGASSGQNLQGQNSISIGEYSANDRQDINSVAIGYYAGNLIQGQYSVAIGSSAGQTTQKPFAVSIGANSGTNDQLTGAVAVGYNAGNNNQGQYSIAIGYEAGQTSLPNNTICINASGAALNPATSGVFISSLNSSSNNSNVQYNPTTSEISYSLTYITRCTVLPFSAINNTPTNMLFNSPTDNLNWPSPISLGYKIYFPVPGYYHVDVQLGDMPTVYVGSPLNIGYSIFNSSAVVLESYNLAGDGATTDHTRDNSGFVVYISDITNYFVPNVYQKSGVTVTFTNGFLHMFKIN